MHNEEDDDLNSEKMVEKCCSCVGWGYARVPQKDGQGLP